MYSWLSIFIGGGLGSLCRFGMNKTLSNQTQFLPIGTLLANIIACLILGILLGIEAKKGMSGNIKLLFITGFCGGFSTFSSYSAETYSMIQNGDWKTAIFYIISSVVICLLSIGVGLFVVRMF